MIVTTSVRGVGTSHISNIRQTSVTSQRLLEDVSAVTYRRENKGTARRDVAFSVRREVLKEDTTRSLS
jgi:hypothetical protein